jgi:farnesyl-diphosphate farnesyltransferase
MLWCRCIENEDRARRIVGDIPEALRPLLKHVSRSFYLTLAVLPPALRAPLGVAYLLARAADTITDTRLVPPEDRLRSLDLFRQETDLSAASRLQEITQPLTGPQRNPAERELLGRLPECFDAFRRLPEVDRRRIRALLLSLTHGMQADLRRFPAEDDDRIVALESSADLDQYTYYAAGCVGEFWTEMALAHCPALCGWDAAAMRGRGMRFGQGLQMTNVLRDLAHDLRIGRCYLPRQDLARVSLTPEDLRDPAALARLRPLLGELLARTLDHYAEGWAYLLAIPPSEVRLRLACAWPLFIGLRTLERLQQAPDLLDPRVTVKISRPAVYAILLRSVATVWSNAGLDRYHRALRGRAASAASPAG